MSIWSWCGARRVAIPALVALAAGQTFARSDQPSGSEAAAARAARIERQLASNPAAIPTIADWTLGAEPFDARYTADGQVGEAASRSLEALAGTPAWTAKLAEAARLQQAIPELRIDDHELYGTPKFVRSTAAFLTAVDAKGTDPKDLVAAYIHEHAALFGIDALEIPAARVDRDFKTDHNGVTHLTLQQQYKGVDIFEAQVRANLMPDGRLINISSTMLPRPAGDFAAAAFSIQPARAIALAAKSVGISLSAEVRPNSSPVGANARTVWQTPPELRPDEPLVTELVYFPLTREIIRPAYMVVVPARGVGHTYEIIIDAADGSLLHRHNRLVWDSTQPVTMRVYTGDGVAPMSPGLATPSATQAPLATRNLVTVNPADVIAFSPNGWINDGNMETLGNNVDAHLDLDANNTADTPRPNGGASRIFDFPLDPSQAPSTYSSAVVTQMFYWCNLYHDRLYAMGFNEAARNFQTTNFSGLGTGNDPVQADTQDGNGAGANTNNANFSTSGTDGSTARVQMYLFNGPTPDRDGGLDGDIVLHELTHGLSIRLHAGITALQTRCMGEGWSDYFGICLLAEPTDDPNLNYTTGPYTTYQLATPTYTSNYYFGIRRFPYSVNLAINPLTFADLDTAQYSVPGSVPISPLVGVALSATANEVHNGGEIWCNTLLECRAALWNRDGFSGNQLMMQLTVDGMKLSPANPTFLQSRDAILQADLANNAAANRIELWTAFAKRGMGSAAVSASSANTTVTENYTVPFSAVFTYPSGRPTQLAPATAASFPVQITGSGTTITPGTARLDYSVNGGTTTSVSLVPTANPNEYTVSLPALSCFDKISYSIRVGTSLGDRTDPATGSYLAQVYTGVSVVTTDDFETDTGWTVGPNVATSGIWTRADPIGTAAQPEDDRSPVGTLCWFTGQGVVGGAIGAADVDGGTTILTSPIFNLTGLPDARVAYSRWYSNGLGGAPFADTFRVEVSINGGSSWQPAETVGPASSPDTQPGWRDASWTLSQLGLAPTAQVRVRFIADDAATGSVVEAAIDDFRIETLECISTPACAADFNNSGDLSVQDIFDFLAAYFSGSPTADFNNSTDITVQDIFDYLNAYFTGCP